MRLVTFRTTAGTRAGRVDGDTVVELPFADVGAVLASGDDWRARVAAVDDGARHATADLSLAPVVTRPGKIVCLGLNYRSHVEEMGMAPPAYPTLFAKFAEALIGATDPIVLPAVSACVDWEVELGVVIGRRVRHVTPADAAEAIAGFTVVNDVSVRDWQWRTSEWLQGKTFESTTPVGPALVTGDEIGDAADLAVGCEVDGVVVQRGRTSDLLFDPATIVAYLSTILTLEPGDLVSTGTPGGVGAGRTPPVYLQPGQVVRTWIDGIGELVNRCEPEADGAQP